MPTCFFFIKSHVLLQNGAEAARSGKIFVFGENIAARVVSTPQANKPPDGQQKQSNEEQKEASKAEEGSPSQAALPPDDDIATPGT